MLNRTVNIDFSKKCGKIKPLHGINGGPRSGGYNLPYDFSEEFSELAVPIVRTSTPKGEYGFNQFVNVHCIFPDFDADEELAESYNFLPTDLYLDSIKSTGAEIFFRLGEAVEPYSAKLYVGCPQNKEKWARICEHIIMHYNEGWANGFKLGIKYFEIWNAADSGAGFSSEAREFYELYRVCANHLKERFPKIKIGAYGAGGFYALNRLGVTEEMKSYIPFMKQFFEYITAKDTYAPLDFFTWTCYTSNPEELAMHIKYARSYLDGEGLRRTRSIVCEYNSAENAPIPNALREDYAAELGVSLILAQRGAVDMMMYSTSDIYSRSNGLFTLDDFVAHRHYCAYSVMRAFGRLYRLGSVAETSAEYRKEVYALTAFNSKEGGILLITREYAGRVEIALRNCSLNTCSVVKTVPGGERGAGTDYKAENIAITSKIILSTKKNEIYYISLFNK